MPITFISFFTKKIPASSMIPLLMTLFSSLFEKSERRVKEFIQIITFFLSERRVKAHLLITFFFQKVKEE